MKITVVGAGIVGLCAAWALTRRGASVTVVEKGPIPNPTAASADHHRMIRRAYPRNPGYGARMSAAYTAWDRLFADLTADGAGPDTRFIKRTGVLTLSERPGDYGAETRRLFREQGTPHEALEGPDAIAAHLPHLDLVGLASNALMAVLAEGGALMANRILVALADWLRHAGAEIHELSPVTAIDRERATVTLASGAEIAGDLVIASAGAGMPELLPGVLPVEHRRTLILYARPPEDLAEAWENAPCWSGLGGEDDLWGIAPIEGIAPKLGAGALGRNDPDDMDRTATPAETARILSAYRGRLRGIERFTPLFAQANYWMLAPEEQFQLRREGSLLATSADSGHGFKFGALSGEDLADAALGREPIDRIADRMAARSPTAI
ncbi:MAG: FAD-dependent oxidoreductase [Pseudomonadota bacterium]